MHVIIFFRNECQAIYSALLRTLIRLQRTNELLNVAERGRAQALNDIMKLQYSEWLACGSIEPEGTMPYIASDIAGYFYCGRYCFVEFFYFFCCNCRSEIFFLPFLPFLSALLLSLHFAFHIHSNCGKKLDVNYGQSLEMGPWSIIGIIKKITISSIVIGLKNSYFPLIHLRSCYRTLQ